MIFPIRITIPYRWLHGGLLKVLFSRFDFFFTPRRTEPLRFSIGHKNAPVIAVLLLLASTSINGSVVHDGILGVDGVNPLDIMALFISLVR